MRLLNVFDDPIVTCRIGLPSLDLFRSVGVWIDERYRWRILWLTSAAIGDLSDIALNYYLVVRKCRQAEIPDWLLRKMLMNNAVSAGLGLVPVAGKEISPKSRLD